MATLEYKLVTTGRVGHEIVAEALEARIDSGVLDPAETQVAHGIIRRAVGLLLARKTITRHEEQRIKDRWKGFL
jgi:hypothetical protein